MGLEIVSVVDEGLGHSAHVLVTGDGVALVVDPLRTPGPYRELAAARGWQLRWAADTHLHADHVSGGPELARQGLYYLAPAAAGLEAEHEALAHGDELDLEAGVRLRVLATPGHTPDHLAYVACDGERPVAVFTGGSLMVGTVGRPDLVGDGEAASSQTLGTFGVALPPERVRTELARAMWHSLHELLTLPDEVVVYPTHGAGSFCAAPGSTERTTTIGRERATNPLLRLPDEDSFVAELLGGLTSVPNHFRWLPALNRRGASPVPPAHLRPLPVDDVQRLLDEGAQVVDVRPVTAFAAGHVPGALSNPLRPAFASWLGWLGDPDRPLVFVADDATDRAELLRQCAAVGFDRIAGELAGGVDGWRDAGRPLATTELVEARDVAGPVLDVRQDHEFRAGHLPGAVHVPLGDLPRAHLSRLPPEDAWTVMCGHGERAATAASLLARAGHPPPRVVVGGGPNDWAAATGRALVSDA